MNGLKLKVVVGRGFSNIIEVREVWVVDADPDEKGREEKVGLESMRVGAGALNEIVEVLEVPDPSLSESESSVRSTNLTVF